jgi:hypothetical protein
MQADIRELPFIISRSRQILLTAASRRTTYLLRFGRLEPKP